MKKIFTLLSFSMLIGTTAQAQLTPGTVAPDFTVTDINGNSYHLYDLLDQGKTVYLDFFATWCGPCWNYHNTHAFRDLWDTYGPPGTDEAMVFSIEGDPNTNHACLFGPSGCVGGTQGDWVEDTPYPIVEDPAVRAMYAVSYYPTIYVICPANKKVYETGQLNMNGLWNFRNNTCPVPVVNSEVVNVQNVSCFGSNTGAVNISVSGGTAPYSYNWSNGNHNEDLTNVPAGTYTCTITSSNGWTGVTDPITVEGPSQAIVVTVIEQNPVGCNGITGSATVEASGGWPGNYSYVWSNGQVGETAYGLNAGNYTVSATDDSGCKKSLIVNVPPAVYPTASIATPASLTCNLTSTQLDAGASSNGSNFVYQWFTSNGGHIVSGGTTLNPVVDAAGNYTLQVTNTSTTCVSYSNTVVTANTTPPTANAGSGGTVSCPQPTTVLEGSGSIGANFIYLWTTSNGGSINSGANTLTPVVGAPGTYTLQVTNTANGCTKTSATAVTGQNVPPSISTTNDTLTCATTAAILFTQTNAGNPTFTWTGPNGFTATVQNPEVVLSGTYNVSVSDTLTGCSNTAIATVTANTNTPGASATGGSLTCVVNNVTIQGSSSASAPLYSWTGPNGFTSALQNPAVGEAGQYVLMVTDPANGCSSTASAAVVLENTPPTASIATPGNLNCNTSQIQLNGTGSSQGSNFAYAWTTPDGNIVSGANSLTPVADQVGVYNLLVTNGNTGCTSVASTSIAQTPPLSAALNLQNNVSCNGASNGSALVAPTGGNGSYTYLWSNGTSLALASNLVAGAYFVTVTDGENCTASGSVSISQPAPLVVNASTTPQSGNGVNDGTATTSPAGGTAAYSYSWNTGASTATITGLAPGNYTVTVTDANSCSEVQTVTVNSFNCALSASISGTNVSCFGQNNGTATVSLLGAINPVLYAWSNGNTTSSVSNLAAGSYTVDITDGNGCPATLNISISEPPLLNANATATHETNTGANDGTASASPAGGSGAYTYLWNTGAVSQTITNLAPDSYSVIVTDGNGCTSEQTVVVNAYNCAILLQVSVSNITCAGAGNGAVTLVPDGGTAPFNYVWNNGGSSATISNLQAGNYTASVTDANGCQFITTASVAEPEPYSAWTTETVQPNCPNEATGSASVAITGGTTPYNFLWSNGQTSNTAENLTAGSYGVTVTDQNGCQSNTSVVVAALDNVPPTVALQNAALTLNSAGLAEVTLSSLSAQLADNCGVASSLIQPNTFDCTQLGQHTVTVTVTDQSGLTATATAFVTVADNTVPVVNCPANIIRCAEDNVIEYSSPVATDNCLGAGGVWDMETGLESGSEFPVGTTVQTHSYTDASGNKGSCTFLVTVSEPVVMNNVSVTNDVNNQAVGAIDITVSGGTAPYTFKWTKDGVSIGDTEDLNNLSEGSYEVVVSDANGCIVHTENIKVENTVAVHDPVWLEGVRMQPNPTSGLVRIVFSRAIAIELEIKVIDADGRMLINHFSNEPFVSTLDCTGLPSGLYFVQFRSGTEVGMRKLVVDR
ncbi:MAG: HYR domain-containing protein [Lewinellaceae bacterium]|nr:HYR domain-containing protein [Lewinellaceae bacterium]